MYYFLILENGEKCLAECSDRNAECVEDTGGEKTCQCKAGYTLDDNKCKTSKLRCLLAKIDDRSHEIRIHKHIEFTHCKCMNT